LLSLTDVSAGPPSYKPDLGEVWQLGRHILVVADVVAGWPLWKPHLTGDALFLPYPGMYVPLALQALTHPLVLVQPDPFLAGHILDKYTAVHGHTEIRRLTDAQVAG
jgi:hypothetical protein